MGNFQSIIGVLGIAAVIASIHTYLFAKVFGPVLDSQEVQLKKINARLEDLARISEDVTSIKLDIYSARNRK